MRICKSVFAVLAAAAVLAAGCSSGDDNGGSVHSGRTSTTFSSAAVSSPAGSPGVTSKLKSEETPYPSDVALGEPAGSATRTAVVPFVAADGRGAIAITGSSEVLDRFGLQGEVSMELADGSIYSPLDLVDRLVNSFRFDGKAQAEFFELSDGRIADNFGVVYSVEAQPFPQAPTATTSTTSAAPVETSPPTETTTTTSTSAAPPAPAVETLQIQVLNGSGKTGAAGALARQLAAEGYIVLQPANAPQRYSTSAIYYREGWQTEAEQIQQTADIEQIEKAIPDIFGTDAAIVILLGTDTAPEDTEERPSQINDTQLPLPDSVPRDRYVPDLADVNIYTEANENNPASAGQLADLAAFLKEIGDCSTHQLGAAQPDRCQNRLPLSRLYQAVEDLLEDLGFTPQNVCGAPAGYSFTDLLQPTRETDSEWRYYTGDAIFTTDRLIELHGGERINPEANLDFYIRQAAQTAHDALRLPELLDETEAPQLILCRAFLAPSGEVPEFANAAWYALLTPGIQPRESLLSQGTYHVKEISRNGNFAYIVVCHPTIGARFVLLHWREAGYRAEIVEDIRTSGCQAAFEEYDSFFAGTVPSGSGSYFGEDTISFSFSERVFSPADF